MTANPDSARVARQARNASMAMAEVGLPARFLLRDHGSKFTKDFGAVFEADGTEVKRVGPVAPNLNAHAERFAQTLRQECLDHFLILGENHLRYVVKSFVGHHNTERPHQGRGNVPLPVAQAADAGEPRILPLPRGGVRCRERLGGLIRHYHRAAAGPDPRPVTTHCHRPPGDPVPHAPTPVRSLPTPPSSRHERPASGPTTHVLDIRSPTLHPAAPRKPCPPSRTTFLTTTGCDFGRSGSRGRAI